MLDDLPSLEEATAELIAAAEAWAVESAALFNPAPPKPRQVIEVPDPALRCMSWGERPYRGDFEYLKGLVRPGETADREFPSAGRRCSKCGRPFKTTPRRRMLCKSCFASQSTSPFAPEMA